MTIPFQRKLPEIPENVSELRIHGVSGTPPSAMLKSYPIRISGEERCGVFRRVEGGPDRAYWWGGLTSGSWVQALWLLLLPFAFVNVAGWMFSRPDVDGNPGSWNDPNAKPTKAWRTRLKARALMTRLLAMGLTVLFVCLLMSGLVESAALGPGRGLCAASRLNVPGSCWWAAQPESRRVLSGVVAVHAVVVGVIVLSGLTRRRFEQEQQHPQSGTEPLGLGAPGAGFHRSAMWSTAFFPNFLADAHRTLAFSALAWITLGLFQAGALTWARLPAAAYALLALGAVAQVTLWEQTEEDHAEVLRKVMSLVSWLAVLPAAAAVWKLAQSPASETFDARVIAELVGATVVGVLLLFIGLALLRLFTPKGSSRYPTRKGWFVSFAREGGAMYVVGIGAALAFGSGVVETIGWLASHEDEHHTVRAWLAIGFLVTAVMVACRFLLKLLPLDSGTRRQKTVRLREAVEDALHWPLTLLCWVPLAVIGLLLLLAKLPFTDGGDVYELPLGSLAFPGLGWVDNSLATVVVLAPLALVIAHRSRVWRIALVAVLALSIAVMSLGKPSLVAVAIWSTLLIPLVIIGYLIIRGRRDEPLRRAIGVVWDLVIFWPRWFHPWAPPPYTEVAVPNLLKVLPDIPIPPDRPSVILSAHSQGAVIAFAAFRSLGRERAVIGHRDQGHVRLLTYGNLIAKHYRELFPSFFTPEDVDYVDEVLERRWLNAYRPTDPLGHPIPELDERDVKYDYSGAASEPYGHSDYLYSAQYSADLRKLADMPNS